MRFRQGTAEEEAWQGAAVVVVEQEAEVDDVSVVVADNKFLNSISLTVNFVHLRSFNI